MGSKKALTKPTLFMLYGYPGSGKSYFARQFCEEVNAAHVHADRIRAELFEEPQFDKQENEIVNHLMGYMAGEFLNAGVSVMFDINVLRQAQRRELREIAKHYHADVMMLWFQIDPDSAFARANKRDKRRIDDRYTKPTTRQEFEAAARSMQNPTGNEEYLVISGKHTFHTQRVSVLKKLHDLGLVDSATTTQVHTVKPGLVNLIPKGRVDDARRNIFIR